MSIFPHVKLLLPLAHILLISVCPYCGQFRVAPHLSMTVGAVWQLSHPLNNFED